MSLKLVPFESLGAVSYSPSIVTVTVYVAVWERQRVVWPWKCGLGRSRKWHHLTDRIRVPISPSIVTLAIFCIVGEIQPLIGRKSRNFYTPSVFSAPAGGDQVGILWKCLMLVKLEWLGYRMVKNYDDMLSRFHMIPERNGRTDGQTDRFAISISRVSMLTRDKNSNAQGSAATRERALIGRHSACNLVDTKSVKLAWSSRR